MERLFDRITLRLAPGERLGIVGVNGAGKSTLLRMLAGQIPPDAGRLKRGKTVQTAVLNQEVTEFDAMPQLRVLEVIEAEKRVVNSRPPGSWSNSSVSARRSSGRRWVTSPAVNGAGCNCSG